MTLKLDLMCDGKPAGRRARRAVRALIEAALAVDNVDEVYVGISCVDAQRIAALNRDYRGRDAPTNVLSFPGSGAPLTPRSKFRDLGEVVLYPGYAVQEAERVGMDATVRLAHLVIHGALHLLGYDHETGAAQQAEMEAIEANILAGLEPWVFHGLTGLLPPIGS